MIYYRRPTSDEIKLLDLLIDASGKQIDPAWRSTIIIKPLKDGSMGSFEIFLDGKIVQKRVFGKQITTCTGKDLDGVTVSIALNTDEAGNLYELDIWKVDYTPVKEIHIGNQIYRITPLDPTGKHME